MLRVSLKDPSSELETRLFLEQLSGNPKESSEDTHAFVLDDETHHASESELGGAESLDGRGGNGHRGNRESREFHCDWFINQG